MATGGSKAEQVCRPFLLLERHLHYDRGHHRHPLGLLRWGGSFFLFVKGHGRPQTFFQGRAKIFQGGQEPTFCLKNNKNDTIFPKKSLKTYYFWPALAGQGGQEPPLPSPADAHVKGASIGELFCFFFGRAPVEKHCFYIHLQKVRRLLNLSRPYKKTDCCFAWPMVFVTSLVLKNRLSKISHFIVINRLWQIFTMKHGLTVRQF